MSSKVRVPFEGQTVDADDLKFEIKSETVGVYEAEDGTVIKITHICNAIYRLNDRKAADGSTMYLVMGSAKMEKTEKPSVVNAQPEVGA